MCSKIYKSTFNCKNYKLQKNVGVCVVDKSVTVTVINYLTNHAASLCCLGNGNTSKILVQYMEILQETVLYNTW